MFIVMVVLGRVCEGQTAYITNDASNFVSVIDVTTNTVTANIPTVVYGWGITVSKDGSRVYFGNWADSIVRVINTSTNSVIASIHLGSNFQNGLAISPDGSKVYAVSGFYKGTVSVINTSTNVVSATIGGFFFPKGIAISPSGMVAYVSEENDSVKVIWTPTNSVFSSIHVSGNPGGICFSPTSSYVYVACASSGTISVINTSTNTVSATIPVGSNPWGICVSPDGSKVYVANDSSNSVSVINTATNSVSATIAVGANPSGISISPDGSKVLVANKYDYTVSVINSATDTVVATVPVGYAPIAFGNFISTYTSSLTVDSIGTLYCSGDSLLIHYHTPDTLNNSNIFSAQLSNSSGNFASAVVIGTLADTVSGTISAVIPPGTATGGGYRIRVVSSSPVKAGHDNGYDITINHSYHLNVSIAKCQGQTYTFPDGTIGSASTVHDSHYTNVLGCDSIIHNILTVSPNPIVTLSSDTICAGDTATLIASGATYYNWSPGAHASGVNTATATPNVTTNYWVIGHMLGCIDTAYATITIDCTVGINQFSMENDIDIYPNPFTLQTTITSTKYELQNIKIKNVLGEEIRN